LKTNRFLSKDCVTDKLVVERTALMKHILKRSSIILVCVSIYSIFLDFMQHSQPRIRLDSRPNLLFDEQNCVWQECILLYTFFIYGLNSLMSREDGSREGLKYELCHQKTNMNQSKIAYFDQYLRKIEN
jgi:hypothetical protein